MIESYSFGRMVVQGQVFTDDVLICGDTIVSPWWRQSGHAVTVRDLEPVLEHNPDVVILGQGQPGQMRATQELKGYLGEQGIELIQVPTREAVVRFNERLELGSQVCGGFHLTC